MQGAPAESSYRTAIERALDHARHILPDQGPIGVFVHHNTLHAFQHLPFHEAVPAGAELLGARAYLALDEFRHAYARGRIEAVDLDEALSRVLGASGDEPLPLGLSRRDLWRVLLLDGIDEDDAGGVRFVRDHAPTGPDALQLAAESRLARTPRASGVMRPARRHRDALLALAGVDSDTPVNAELIRLSAVFLDHGQALQAMPHRVDGFLAATAYLFDAGAPEPRGCPGVRADVCDAVHAGSSARQVIETVLRTLGVPSSQAEDYLLRTALALPGWTGMFARLERHPEEHPIESRVALEDFLAVRLLHDRRAIEAEAHAAGLPVEWPTLRAIAERPVARPPLLDAWMLAGLARCAGLSAAAIDAVPDDALAALWREVEAAPRLLRQRVWQEAYEGHYRRRVLDGLASLRAHRAELREPPTRAEAQFVFCIDEREESIRRAIDEQPGRFETFGVAGFFGMAIDYQGLYDPTPAAYCPVVVTPQHEIHEAPVYTDREWHLARAGWRARWQAAGRLMHRHSRTLSGGAGLSLLLGPLAAATALARVVAPRASLAWRDRIRDRLAPRPATRLSSLREEGGLATPTDRGKAVGFATDEAADRVAALLRNIGLVRDLAPIVVILGHGSTSLNNPHESAHDCGACGGRRGEANARLFADMANRPEIRAGLLARGIAIPSDTWFVGALHDTADDGVRYADLNQLPSTHVAHFERAHATLERARAVAAAERVRRFDDAPLGMSPAAALRHVETRASHLAQPRPEYGHCTNAACVVGRRELTRGLHLDRRAFLVSYDPSIDPELAILERILAAVGPVGAGINLEYYFSSVDNEHFGCGTKLPHNVTGLIGVMSGHQSDLRTGLPLQMVELHEPMRLLLIVEATPASLLAIAGRQAEVRELVVNEWVQLVSVDPGSGAMTIFRDGAFVPYTPTATSTPVVHRSVQWHGATRDHVAPALVLDAMTRLEPNAALSSPPPYSAVA
jgi:uncharacterized protein